MPNFLYVVRHGQTEWNVQGRVQGRQDSPLTPIGVAQAHSLGRQLAHIPFRKIYASSSARTVHTAEIVGSYTPADIEQDSRLLDINMGQWEGLTWDEVKEQYVKKHDLFWNDPALYKPVRGGESFVDVWKRAQDFLDHTVKTHSDETVLVITHSVVVKALVSLCANRPISAIWEPPVIQPASISVIRIDDSGDSVVEVTGDVTHLEIDNPKTIPK